MRLGEFDTSNDIKQQDCITSIGGGYDCNDGAVVIPIEKVTAHPNYNPYETKTRRHDIALLRMTAPAPYTGKLITITVHISVWRAAVSNK